MKNGNTYKPTSRTEIIYELAKYAHPEWYHDLLTWTTPQLRRLLAYYMGMYQTTIEVGFIPYRVDAENLAELTKGYDLFELSLVKA